MKIPKERKISDTITVISEWEDDGKMVNSRTSYTVDMQHEGEIQAGQIYPFFGEKFFGTFEERNKAVEKELKDGGTIVPLPW